MIDQQDRFDRAFERFEMPEPAFDRLVDRRERIRRREKALAAGVAVIVGLLSIVIAVRAFSPNQRPAAPPGPSPEPSQEIDTQTRRELRALVLDRSAQPDGLPFAADAFGMNAVTRPLQGSSVESNLAAQDGALDGIAIEFREGGRFIATFAAVYEDEQAASRALAVYQGAFASDYGYSRPPRRTAWGEEGFRFLERSGAPTVTYFWRRGALLLNVHATGEVDLAQIRAIAEGMDDRAEAHLEA